MYIYFIYSKLKNYKNLLDKSLDSLLLENYLY